MDHWAENYYEEGSNFFLKKYVASLFTISEKIRATCEFRF